MTSEQTPDFDIDGANWIDRTTLGSIYEEQLDISRQNGMWRHRIRAVYDEPHDPWREGRAPTGRGPE